MVEYRIQAQNNNGQWKFVIDGHGKFYTYTSLATAKRYGPDHAQNSWNQETHRWEFHPERFRIVKADIDWEVVESD